MKKSLLSILMTMVLLTVCVFMVSGAYSNDVFSFDVPDSFVLEESDGGYTWTNDNESVIYIYYGDNLAGMNYDSLTDIEISVMNEQIASTYENLDGLVFDGNVDGSNVDFGGHRAYRYELECDIRGLDCTVLGYIFVADGNQYTIETVAMDGDEDEIADILSSFRTVSYNEEPVEEDVTALSGKRTVTSEDGVISFEIGSDFVKSSTQPSGVIDETWADMESPRAGFAYGVGENTDGMDFSDLSDLEMELFLGSFVETADGMFSNGEIEQYDQNSLKGIKVKGDMVVVGVDCVMSMYLFSTEEHIIYLYGYEYEEGASAKIDEIISTVKIKGFDYSEGSDEGFIGMIFMFVGFILFIVLAIILVIVIVVIARRGKKKKNQAPANAAFSQNNTYMGNNNQFNNNQYGSNQVYNNQVSNDQINNDQFNNMN